MLLDNNEYNNEIIDMNLIKKIGVLSIAYIFIDFQMHYFF